MSTTPWLNSVRLGDPLRAHLSAAVDQLSRSTPYSVDLVVQDVRWADGRERLFQDYRGDVSGRYLDAVAVAHDQGMAIDEEKAAAVLREVLRAQQPDGFFGPPAPALRVDHGSAWGHGRLLEGLMSAQQWASGDLADATGRSAALLAEAIGTRAEQWARWVRGAGRQKFRLDPLSAVLPMARFAETADSKRALYAARTLAEALPPDVDGAHMHGYLLALRGQLEVGRLTGSDDLVRDVRERADEVAARYLLPHGAVPESVTVPLDLNTEGCGIADWIMLNLRLYALFGDSRHLDRATLSAFNALLHTQRASGHFGCETLSGEDGVLVSDYAPEAWWCCTFHGIRALHQLGEQAATVDDGVVSLHVPMSLMLSGIGDDSLLTVEGAYPYGDRIEVTVGPGFHHSALRVRIPSTAAVGGVFLDGRRSEVTAAEGWIVLSGLQPGSRVTLVLDQHEWFSVDGDVVVPPFANTTAPVPDLSGSGCAVFRGPLLLAAHSPENSVEDLLRSQFLVHPRTRAGLERGEDGQVRATACGHDSFHTALRMVPLAGDDRSTNDGAVRTWFHGLLFERRSVHGSANL